MRQYHCHVCKRTWREEAIIKVPLHLDSGMETEVYQCPACGSKYIEILQTGVSKKENRQITIAIIGAFVSVCLILSAVFILIKLLS